MFRRMDVRLEGTPMAMYRLSYELQTTLVTYSRHDNSLGLMGPPEVTDRFFDYTDALDINPQMLLGYLTERSAIVPEQRELSKTGSNRVKTSISCRSHVIGYVGDGIPKRKHGFSESKSGKTSITA